MNVDSPEIQPARMWNPAIKTCNPMLIADSPTGACVPCRSRRIVFV